MTGENATLTAALDYLARGWSVLPICPHDHFGVGRGHRGCKSPGKRPFFPDTGSGEWKEFQTRRPSETELRGWFKHHPKINLGLALGQVSGLVGIDIDDEDGEELLMELSGGDLPETWEFTTGKGRRILYRLPPGVDVVTQSFTRPGTEIEILKLMGRGSQTVIPPSIHPSGASYSWRPFLSPDDRPAADAPAWLRDRRVREDAKTTRPGDGEMITEGGRNSYLTSLAGAMRKRGADEHVILAALRATNESRFDPQLEDFEVQAVARSVARYAPDEFTGVTIKFPEPGTGTAPKEEPDPKTADDVAGIDDLKAAGAAVRWLWPGWIQIGVVTAVGAEGGTGKTRLTADIVRRIRHRLTWPDGAPVAVEAGPTVALWVVSDNHHDEMVSLTDAFGIADCVKVNAGKADPYGGVTLETVEDLAMLEKRIKVCRPTLVVIDTVGNSTDKNLSRQEDSKMYYQPLQLIARRQSVAMLCLTHLNASGKVLGRRALEKVRTYFRMSAERVNDSTCKRRLEVMKSNSKYPSALGVTMGTNGNEYDDQPPPPPEDRENEPKVGASTVECGDWLKEQLANGPRPVGELREEAEGNGWSSKTLYDAKRLVKATETKGGSRKYWSLGGDAPSPIKVRYGQEVVS